MKDHLPMFVIALGVIALTVYGLVLMTNAENNAHKRWEARRALFMGHSFLLNGQTYTAITLSSWDGKVLCISATGKDVELDWLAVETLVTVTAEQRP